MARGGQASGLGQAVVGGVEEGSHPLARRRLLLQRLGVPEAAWLVEKVATVNVDRARKGPAVGVGDGVNGLVSEHHGVLRRQLFSSRRDQPLGAAAEETVVLGAPV